MKLWIDDLRPAPDGFVQAWSSDGAVLHLLARHAELEEISFDHDLGGDDTTRPVMLWMIENDVWPDRIFVHTANPVGRTWLVEMAKRYAPEHVEVKW